MPRRPPALVCALACVLACLAVAPHAGAVRNGKQATARAGAERLAAAAEGQTHLHHAIYHAPQLLAHPGVRTLLRAIVAERVPAGALSVLRAAPTLVPLIPYRQQGLKLYQIERRVLRSNPSRSMLGRLAGHLLEAGLEVADTAANPFERYFAGKWRERFADQPLWPAPRYRRRRPGDYARVGAHERIVTTLAGAPLWTLDDHHHGQGELSELHLIRGLKYLGFSEYRVRPGGLLEYHNTVHRGFQGLGIPSVLMATLLKNNPGVRRIPSQLAQANWRAFIGALGKSRLALTRSDKRLFGLSHRDRRALVAAIVDAVRTTPAAKLRVRHGFSRIARVVVQPHADPWNKVLVDFHRGRAGSDATIEVVFVTKTGTWKHTPKGLLATEGGIAGFEPRQWVSIPR